GKPGTPTGSGRAGPVSSTPASGSSHPRRPTPASPSCARDSPNRRSTSRSGHREPGNDSGSTWPTQACGSRSSTTGSGTARTRSGTAPTGGRTTCSTRWAGAGCAHPTTNFTNRATAWDASSTWTHACPAVRGPGVMRGTTRGRGQAICRLDDRKVLSRYVPDWEHSGSRLLSNRRARAGSGAGQALLLGGDGGDQGVARRHVEQGEQRGDPLAVILQRCGRGDLR